MITCMYTPLLWPTRAYPLYLHRHISIMGDQISKTTCTIVMNSAAISRICMAVWFSCRSNINTSPAGSTFTISRLPWLPRYITLLKSMLVWQCYDISVTMSTYYRCKGMKSPRLHCPPACKFSIRVITPYRFIPWTSWPMLEHLEAGQSSPNPFYPGTSEPIVPVWLLQWKLDDAISTSWICVGRSSIKSIPVDDMRLTWT